MSVLRVRKLADQRVPHIAADEPQLAQLNSRVLFGLCMAETCSVLPTPEPPSRTKMCLGRKPSCSTARTQPPSSPHVLPKLAQTLPVIWESRASTQNRRYLRLSPPSWLPVGARNLPCPTRPPTTTRTLALLQIGGDRRRPLDSPSKRAGCKAEPRTAVACWTFRPKEWAVRRNHASAAE